MASSVNTRSFYCVVIPRTNGTISTRVGGLTFRCGIPLIGTSIRYGVPSFRPLCVRTLGFTRGNGVVIIHLSRRGNSHNVVGLNGGIGLLGVLRRIRNRTSSVRCSPFRVVAVKVRV